MTDCLYNDDGPPWTCKWCGTTYSRHGKPRMTPKAPRGPKCPNAPDLTEAAAELNIASKDVPRYHGLLREWLAAGKPERTFAKQKELIEEHCQACDLHADGDCHGVKNGCKKKDMSLPRSVWALARMATAGCPEGNW